MRLLAVDIGNTHITCGIFEKTNLIHKFRINTNILFWNDLKKIKKYKISNIIISSVSPYYNDLFIDASQDIFDVTPYIIQHTDSLIKLNVDSSEEVGIDRICNMSASIQKFKSPMIIIDFGTATTYDVIDQNGNFIGGVIAPGIETSAKNLFNNAALLSKIKLRIPKNVIGKNTETNLQSGIMYHAIDALEGMINRLITELEKPANIKFILTGGFSKTISPLINLEHELDRDLTLLGILAIYNNINS